MPNSRTFIADRRGNVAITFALLITFLLLVVGAAIDYARAVAAKLQLQAGTDAAAMQIATSKPAVSAAGKMAQSVLDTNTNFKSTISSIVVPVPGSTYTTQLATHYDVPTTFMQIFGKDLIGVDAYAEVTTQSDALQIALVLDNSGSMKDDGKMVNLKIAAIAAVTTIKQNSPQTKFALVPFNGFVNVGPQYQTASWLDDAAPSPHLVAAVRNNGALSSTKRFALFSALGVSWAGCVEARTGGYDVTDTAPTTNATKFVPLFVPDSPGPAPTGNSGDLNFENHYVSDTGDCKTAPSSINMQQDQTCKYYNNPPNKTYTSFSNGPSTPMGPNVACTISPLTRLTSSASTVTAAIEAMQPDGSTDISSGAGWGFRVLSNNGPFADGMTAAEKAKGGRSIMIVMTDGINQVYGMNGMNGSVYTAYGYANDPGGRLPGLISGGVAANLGFDALNNKMIATCNNAKKAGIEIYAIGIGISDAAKVAMTTCATSPDRAYFPTKAEELLPIFKLIVANVSMPFLSQ